MANPGHLLAHAKATPLTNARRRFGHLGGLPIPSPTIHTSRSGGECRRMEKFPIFASLSALAFTEGTVGKAFDLQENGTVKHGVLFSPMPPQLARKRTAK